MLISLDQFISFSLMLKMAVMTTEGSNAQNLDQPHQPHQSHQPHQPHKPQEQHVTPKHQQPQVKIKVKGVGRRKKGKKITQPSQPKAACIGLYVDALVCTYNDNIV